MTARELPEGRYGRTGRPAPRWARPLLLVLVVAAGLGVAVVGYRNLAAAPIEAQLLGFRLLEGNLEGNAVQVRIEVARDDPSAPGVCIVRARSRDGDETGRREVYVPPATGSLVVATVVRTSRPPVTGDVYGCSLEIPAYLGPPRRAAPPGAGG
ncbi:MAG: DUF4307 domain-containing protein [Pseudonocardiaceae bacterium]